jgi:tripartite-type tricarboxylate transporter receptor subunit TctC
MGCDMDAGNAGANGEVSRPPDPPDLPVSAGRHGGRECAAACAAVSKSIGQQVVVDNRAGASGIIGTAEAARAKPDGYTIISTRRRW